MPSSRSPSPAVAALRAAAEAAVRQLRDDVREQAGLIRSGAAGAVTEADVERLAEEIAAAARARLDAAAPPSPNPSAGPDSSADPELEATRRQAAALLTAASREADAALRRAWRAGPEEAPGGRRRPWRRPR